MRTIELREFEVRPVQPEEVIRNGRLYVDAAVANRDYFEVRLSAEAMEIAARGWIGIIRVNDTLTLDVKPRVSVSNLARLLRLSGQQPRYLEQSLRRYVRSGELYPPIISLYSDALARAVDEIAAKGLIREYHRREESTSWPHGRILMGQTIRTHLARGETYRVRVSWYERTIDNPINRALLFAIYRLAAYARRYRAALGNPTSRRISRQLNLARLRLQGVELDRTETFRRNAVVAGRAPIQRSRDYYEPALELARAIMAGEAVALEYEDGSLRLPSLLINMADVFEDYLREALRLQCRSRGAVNLVLDGNVSPGRKLLLDEGTAIDAQPDILVYSTSEQRGPPIVLEVKYKPAGSRPDRPDLEQALAYGVSYRAQHVVLVQPRGDKSPKGALHSVGGLIGMRLWLYIYDMGAPSLEAEEEQFTAAILALGT